MNIGLFGGTFNPFHNGHIGIIESVKKQYGLEKIFFIPSATPPHKSDINLACANDRFNMVKTSLETFDDFFVSDKELTREGPSFTIDTINEFRNEHDSSTRFYLLMGSDAFLDITTWKDKEQVKNSRVSSRATSRARELISRETKERRGDTPEPILERVWEN